MPKKIWTDEDFLQWVRWRCQGYEASSIAHHVGVSTEYVRAATNRIRNADLEESGEHSTVVLRAYW